MFFKYLRLLKKIVSDEINGENHFKYDRRKESKITKTISKFIEIMPSRNGFLTGTELSHRIKRVLKVILQPEQFKTTEIKF
jgi:hypothetical protein